MVACKPERRIRCRSALHHGRPRNGHTHAEKHSGHDFWNGAERCHVAPALSIVEICAVLYGAVMKLDFRTRSGRIGTGFAQQGTRRPGSLRGAGRGGLPHAGRARTFEAPESLLSGQPTMCVEKGIEISSEAWAGPFGRHSSRSPQGKRGAATGLSSCWAMASATRERSGKRPWRQLISNWAA